MRVLTHEFNDCCQFVFTGSRENSEKIIPKILKMGKSIWGVDLQYYIDTDGLDWKAIKKEKKSNINQEILEIKGFLKKRKQKSNCMNF